MNKVEKFITQFKKEHTKVLEDVFLHGKCYWFAIILKEQFKGEIYYLPIQNHFICKIKNMYYDISGEIKKFDEKPYKWSYYKTRDELEAKRILQYCINFDK